jgi:DNA repair protein RecO
VDDDPRRGSLYFLAASLDLMGYAPQLGACARCESPLPAAPAPFSAAAGGFLCPRCSDPAAVMVETGAIKVLRVMFAGDLALYRRFKLAPSIMDAVEEVLTTQLEYHLDRRLNSLRFLRRMRAAP